MTGLPKRYKYKVEKRTPPPPNTPQVKAVNEKEILTGVIQGKDGASDLEERFSRALDNNPRVRSYTYLKHYFAPLGRSTPGAIELDFMVNSNGNDYPIMIDGPFAHGTQTQRDEDAQKDQRLNDLLGPYGVQDVQRIPNKNDMSYGMLDNQESANELVMRMF